METAALSGPSPPKRMQASGLGLHSIQRVVCEIGSDKTAATLREETTESRDSEEFIHRFAERKAAR